MSSKHPAQGFLPGLGRPDPLGVAREEYQRLHAAWEAVCHIAESEERSRLQPLVRAAAVAVDRLESGPKWWH